MKLLNWLTNSSKNERHSHSSQSQLITEDTIKETFKSCGDVSVDEMTFTSPSNEEKVIFLYSEGLTNTHLIEDDIIPRLDRYFRTAQKFDKQEMIEKMKLSAIVEISERKDLPIKLFKGNLLVFFPSNGYTLSIDISEIPGRNPEETNAEVSVKGARDGFIENIKVNVALIRKRLPTESLKYESFTIGDRSHTEVGLMYVNDIINPAILKEVKKRLKTLKIDGLMNSNTLVEMLSSERFQVLPSLQYTGRPDYSANALLRGRFILLIDGAPTVLVGPVNLFLLLKSGEDAEYISFYNSFERILRIIGLSIAIFLPGFWVAITTYHQDQIPVLLLATLSTSRRGVPFPTAVEALLMLGLFELFREAGSRMPSAIGQTLTVVGGLIIGDAAIRAGFTNPGLIVVIATSLVATFTLVNQSMIGVFSILRIIVVFISSFLGIFGFLISAFSILLYMANLRSFGIPYLVPLSPLSSFRDFKDTILNSSAKKKQARPDFLNTKDSTRK
ncbi:spore germination protein [Salipaludibacillus keqinensis]|uniref:Spore germination protein n=1 Tax=Salipaludibacillus keqinensis TaxID=2045207 RepID=A0A323TKP5_9BACI|nr:spore germination protein [Salipaludibacillus keqinensis]PYZ95170.1 spore germination protein [Salipaludibacillus keqinensis]